MARDPYAQVSKPIRKAAPTPGAFNPMAAAKPAPQPPKPNAFQMDPAQLDAMLSQGYLVGDDGTLLPPAPLMPEAVDETLPPPPGMWENPLFAAHMNVRNPAAPEPDPMKQMQRQQTRALGLQEPKGGPSVGVPGGASIQNGMPMAATTPSPAYTQADDPMKKKGDPYAGRFGNRPQSMPSRRRT